MHSLACIIFEIVSCWTFRAVNAWIKFAVGVDSHSGEDACSVLEDIAVFAGYALTVLCVISLAICWNLIANAVDRVETIRTKTAVGTIDCDSAEGNIEVWSCSCFIVNAFSFIEAIAINTFCALSFGVVTDAGIQSGNLSTCHHALSINQGVAFVAACA